jgi:glucoamylase
MIMGPDIEKHDDTKLQERKPAPGRPGNKPTWNTGHKTAVGTSISSRSRIWFTIAHGYLNEIYFPDVDRANTRCIRFLVSDGSNFLSDEAPDTENEVGAIEPGIPAFKIRIRDKQNRFIIDKEIITDPHCDALIMRVRFKPSSPDLRLYVFVNPHMGDEGEDNNGWVGQYKGTRMLFAERGGLGLALACSAPFKQMSAGYMGVSDGLTYLRSTGTLSEEHTIAEHGHVGLTGEIDWRHNNGEFRIAVGFGGRPAEAGLQARGCLLRDFETIRRSYIDGWREFHSGLTDLTDGRDGDLFRVSAAIARIHESKRFPGAFVASLSVPWGFARGDKDIGGYHVLWPRDLSATVIGLMACGDQDSPVRALYYLACTQESDGHWNQNQWLDGTKHWTSRQMDETSYPILLADAQRRAGKLDCAEIWPMVRKTATYMAVNGPVTDEDRWEDVGGYAIFSMAVEIAALLTSADFAAECGESGTAEFLRDTADAWNDMIDELTYVSGTDLAQRHGVAGYYLRATPPEAISGKPLESLSLVLRNHPKGEQNKRAVDIVSPDALALVRYGLRAADDPRMLDTIKVIDATLMTQTKTGPVWHRYTEDGYGEQKDGAPFNKQTGIGRGWPLLAGERAHYEIARGNLACVEALKRTMEAQTTQCGLIPEQIWDDFDIPERDLFNGHPSGSGCPLVWAHAEYISLLRSMRDRKVWNMPPQTIERYVNQKKSASFQIWTDAQRRGKLARGKDLRIDLKHPVIVEWTKDGWQTSQRENTKDSGVGVHWAMLKVANAPSGLRVQFRFDTEPREQDLGGDVYEVVVA